MIGSEGRRVTLLKSERNKSEIKPIIGVQEEIKEAAIVRHRSRPPKPPMSKQSTNAFGKEEVEASKLPNVSRECLDAIEMLLKKDPSERISIFDFLQHPWL
jgi:serine/threonine protein kinase